MSPYLIFFFINTSFLSRPAGAFTSTPPEGMLCALSLFTDGIVYKAHTVYKEHTVYKKHTVYKGR